MHGWVFLWTLCATDRVVAVLLLVVVDLMVWRARDMQWYAMRNTLYDSSTNILFGAVRTK